MATSPITSWQIEGGKVEAGTDFIFLGSKTTVDGDYGHEIKRCLLLGRKAMANLDSVIKSRDFTLPTKVCRVKIKVYLWTDVIVQPKRMLSTKNWVAALEKSLESPLHCKEIKQVSPRENQPRIFIGKTDAEVEALILWSLMRKTDALKKT